MNKHGLILILFCLLFSQETNRDTIRYSDEPLKDPTTALIYSALLPGSGQYYNESYIKSGIIIIGFSYFLQNAIHYNTKITDLKKSNLSQTNFDKYKNKIDSYYNDRNIAIWQLLGVYVYSTLDAYIGAYLFGFDEIMDDKENSFQSFVGFNNQQFTFNLSIRF